MCVRCTQCGREAWLPQRCAPGDLPDGWQIALSGDGENWFCSPKCAAIWYIVRALSASEDQDEPRRPSTSRLSPTGFRRHLT